MMQKVSSDEDAEFLHAHVIMKSEFWLFRTC